MSASYLRDKSGQIISFSKLTTEPPSRELPLEAMETLGRLPQLLTDIETCFLTIRQLKTDLINAKHHPSSAQSLAAYPHEEIHKLNQQLELLKKEKNKLDLENEILKAGIQAAKQNAVQAVEKKAKLYIHRLQTELQQYKQMWKQEVENNEKIRIAQSEFEKLALQVAEEKQRAETLEELMKKEKREKQVALNCLSNAESKLAELNREIEQLKEHAVKNAEEDTSLEISF